MAKILIVEARFYDDLALVVRLRKELDRRTPTCTPWRPNSATAFATRSGRSPISHSFTTLRRLSTAAGVEPPGKRGAHVFRHARAVEMLRASVPQKIIGDVLGHRSTESTNAYLKLATDDLRAVALDVPGSEVLP